jgi:hypothetical protein
MTIPGDAQKKIEAYLGRLRRGLGGMNRDDVSEIVEELRSHITDRAAADGLMSVAGVDAALAGLGSPEALASQYITNYVLARAEVSRSPVRILESLFRWASLSAAGFAVLLFSIVGYFLGGAFVLCAALKPLHPRSAGLWLLPDRGDGLNISLRLGFGVEPLGGREMLGWWIIPAGLFIGCGLVMLTTRFALWCAARYRKSRALPSP